MPRSRLATVVILMGVLVAGCTGPTTPSSGTAPAISTDTPSPTSTHTAQEAVAGCPLTPHEGQWPRCIDSDDDGVFERVCRDNIECYCDTPQSADHCSPYVLHHNGMVYNTSG